MWRLEVCRCATDRAEPAGCVRERAASVGSVKATDFRATLRGWAKPAVCVRDTTGSVGCVRDGVQRIVYVRDTARSIGCVRDGVQRIVYVRDTARSIGCARGGAGQSLQVLWSRVSQVCEAHNRIHQVCERRSGLCLVCGAVLQMEKRPSAVLCCAADETGTDGCDGNEAEVDQRLCGVYGTEKRSVEQVKLQDVVNPHLRPV